MGAERHDTRASPLDSWRAAAATGVPIRHRPRRSALVEETARRVAAMASGPAQAVSPVFLETHNVLRRGRSLALADMPAGAQTYSSGANGAWYFDWVEREYGRVKRHIGVEASSPSRPTSRKTSSGWRPIWLVPTEWPAWGLGAIDLVFSAKTFDVWPDQMLAFLVVEPGSLRRQLAGDQ